MEIYIQYVCVRVCVCTLVNQPLPGGDWMALAALAGTGANGCLET